MFEPAGIQKSIYQQSWDKNERLEFLAHVASLYYEDGKTQNEISAMLGYSRSAISRFLTEAREAGVVEIRVNHPLVRDYNLEEALTQRFFLRKARVLVHEETDFERMLARLGALAAQLLNTEVTDNTMLGVSWGTAVHAVARALRPPHYPNIKVAQLIGSLGTTNPRLDGPELAQWFAQVYGGQYLTLPAPLIVDTPAIRDALLSDSNLRSLLSIIAQTDVALVGIGTTDPTTGSLARAGYLTPDELAKVARDGAVGDVCAIHVSEKGEVLDIPIARRVIGIDPDTLRKIPLVIGVSAGRHKVRAILGALRSRLVNVLVTDEITGRLVLELDQQELDG